MKVHNDELRDWLELFYRFALLVSLTVVALFDPLKSAFAG